jgi:hypothetical protein
MLTPLFKVLDEWIMDENKKSQKEGFVPLKPCEIYIIGQTALIEADLKFHLAATMDVDVYRELEYSIKKQFESLLKAEGKELDPVGHEAWMPEETKWISLFEGQFVRGFISKPEYIMVSKALKAPKKNHTLLIDYIASEPPDLFFELAAKYEVNLEDFLK